VSDDVLAIERRFPQLHGRLPRVTLTRLPTRTQRLTRLGDELGIPRLWVKHDDESGAIYGGNKPRKLEFILGDVRARGKSSVMTFGGIGTHHGLATALCARSIGVRVILGLLKQPLTEQVRDSLLLHHAAGAELFYAPTLPRLAARALGICARELRRGALPYIIPTGGSSPLGTLGYVNAAFELQEQVRAEELPEPDWIFAPVGSGGTVAGLVAGAKLAGLRSRVVGVMVTDIFPPNAARLARLANKSLGLLHRHAAEIEPVRVTAEDFRLVAGYVGPGYGAPTEAGRWARELIAALEGIALETTYTAKCLAAMIDAAALPEYRDSRVLFWNTYSSVDLAARLGPLPDYRQLPPVFHQFFTTSPEAGD